MPYAKKDIFCSISVSDFDANYYPKEPKTNVFVLLILPEFYF